MNKRRQVLRGLGASVATMVAGKAMTQPNPTSATLVKHRPMLRRHLVGQVLSGRTGSERWRGVVEGRPISSQHVALKAGGTVGCPMKSCEGLA